MTARNYDYIITVDDASRFKPGGSFIGNSSATVGYIANVDYTTNNLKVKVNNVLTEFITGEYCYSVESSLRSANTNNYALLAWSNVTPVVGFYSGRTDFPLPATINVNHQSQIFMFARYGNPANYFLLPRETYIWPSPVYGINGVHLRSRLPSSPGANLQQSHTQFRFATGQNVTITTQSGRVYDGSHRFFSGGYRLNREDLKQRELDFRYFSVDDPIANISYGAAYTNLFAAAFDMKFEVLNSNIEAIPYEESYFAANGVTSISRIASIAPSKFIKESQSFEQKPLVRLYTIYYPGEWYYPNEQGNPTGEGAGRPWPYGFPYRFAEIRGDIISDLDYTVQFNNTHYQAYPIDSTGISLSATGEVNEINITIGNFDGMISDLVESRYLVGNSSAGITALVNNEYVTNIDPRTVPSNASYNASVAASRGVNAAIDYDTNTDLGGSWTSLKPDSRDLLGAVVEIRTTFANFLDYWPEFSTVKSVAGANLIMWTGSPYRTGDNVRSNASSTLYMVSDVLNNILTLNTASHGITAGQKVWINNPDADADSYVLDTFKIDSLDALDEKVAKFALTSWLQYFKLTLPKRKFYKNTCPWIYKGPECQYPDSGAGDIPGSLTRSANGWFDLNNAPTLVAANDACAHTEEACSIRNNRLHFGGFPGTGRNLPK